MAAFFPYLVFMAWLAVFAWLWTRPAILNWSGLSNSHILSFLLIKIMAGIVYTGMFMNVPEWQTRVDTWRYFFQSLGETDWLLNDPKGFFADLATPRYAEDSGLLGTHNSLLNDLKEVLVIKLMAISNLVTGRNIAANIVLFNGFTMAGQLVIARIWSKFFRVPMLWPAILVLLWPSVLFWTSAFHRDGLMLHCLGISTWLIYTLWKQKTWKWWQAFFFFIHFGLLFFLRNYLALFFLASCGIAWLWAIGGNKRKLIWYALLAVFAGLWLTGKILPQYHLPSILLDRQEAFKALSGGSLVTPVLHDADWFHLVSSLPVALYRGFLAPFFHSGMKLLEWPAAFESLVLILAFAAFLFWLRKNNLGRNARAWLILAVTLSVSICLITGFTIPYAGAIVRYRSIVLPFFAPLLLFPLLPAAWKKTASMNTL